MSPLVAARAAAAARGYGWGLAAGGPTGGFEAIATFVSDGSISSFTFASIPQNYTSLQIRAMNKSTSSISNEVDARMIFNADGGNNYTYHLLYTNGSTLVADWAATSAGVKPSLMGLTTTGTFTGNFGVSLVDIHDYSTASRYKTISTFNGIQVNASTRYTRVLSHLWTNANPITSITITQESPYLNFAAGSRFELYGWKGAV